MTPTQNWLCQKGKKGPETPEIILFSKNWVKMVKNDQNIKISNFRKMTKLFPKIIMTHRKSGCDNLENVSSLAYLTSCVFNDRADFVKSDDRLEFDQSEER